MNENNSALGTRNSKLILFYNTNSPFARKCRVVIHEKNLWDKVEFIESMPPHDSPALQAANPLSRIPALVMDDGGYLCESPVICEYLDSLSAQNSLFPTDKTKRFEALALAALASGIMDSAVACVMESRRPEDKRVPEWVERKEQAIRRTIKLLAKTDFNEKTEFNIGTLSLAVALGYVSFRMPQIVWQNEYPALAAWLAFTNKRASMIATAPIFIK